VHISNAPNMARFLCQASDAIPRKCVKVVAVWDAERVRGISPCDGAHVGGTSSDTLTQVLTPAQRRDSLKKQHRELTPASPPRFQQCACPLLPGPAPTNRLCERLIQNLGYMQPSACTYIHTHTRMHTHTHTHIYIYIYRKNTRSTHLAFCDFCALGADAVVERKHVRELALAACRGRGRRRGRGGCG
jgi:hypothetical protein